MKKKVYPQHKKQSVDTSTMHSGISTSTFFMILFDRSGLLSNVYGSFASRRARVLIQTMTSELKLEKMYSLQLFNLEEQSGRGREPGALLFSRSKNLPPKPFAQQQVLYAFFKSSKGCVRSLECDSGAVLFDVWKNSRILAILTLPRSYLKSKPASHSSVLWSRLRDACALVFSEESPSVWQEFYGTLADDILLGRGLDAVTGPEQAEGGEKSVDAVADQLLRDVTSASGAATASCTSPAAVQVEAGDKRQPTIIAALALGHDGAVLRTRTTSPSTSSAAVEEEEVGFFATLASKAAEVDVPSMGWLASHETVSVVRRSRTSASSSGTRAWLCSVRVYGLRSRFRTPSPALAASSAMRASADHNDQDHLVLAFLLEQEEAEKFVAASGGGSTAEKIMAELRRRIRASVEKNSERLKYAAGTLEVNPRNYQDFSEFGPSICIPQRGEVVALLAAVSAVGVLVVLRSVGKAKEKLLGKQLLVVEGEGAGGVTQKEAAAVLWRARGEAVSVLGQRETLQAARELEKRAAADSKRAALSNNKRRLRLSPTTMAIDESEEEVKLLSFWQTKSILRLTKIVETETSTSGGCGPSLQVIEFVFLLQNGKKRSSTATEEAVIQNVAREFVAPFCGRYLQSLQPTVDGAPQK